MMQSHQSAQPFLGNHFQINIGIFSAEICKQMLEVKCCRTKARVWQGSKPKTE